MDDTSPAATAPVAGLVQQFARVRRASMDFAATIPPDMQTRQNMPDVSPTKWHLAHTSWFFETFILKPYHAGYTPFNADFEYLFNSYYNGVGAQYPRDRRGEMDEPVLDVVHAYRAHIDAAMTAFLGGSVPNEIQALVVLGLHHEQQHQELMHTDIKHVLFQHGHQGIDHPETRHEEPQQGWVHHPGGGRGLHGHRELRDEWRDPSADHLWHLPPYAPPRLGLSLLDRRSGRQRDLRLRVQSLGLPQSAHLLLPRAREAGPRGYDPLQLHLE